MTPWVLGIDVGGTKTLVGAVGRDGTLAGEWSRPTRGGTDDVAGAIAFARACAAELDSPPSAVAAGFPEYVSADGRLTSAEVLSWSIQPAELLRDGAGLAAARCVVESDVRLGALGEAVYGAGRELPSFLYVSLGTGLSSSFVVDGRVWPGARGEAIAFGERLVGGSDGGSLEAYASGAGIERRYEDAAGVRRRGREIVERAAGEPVAAEVLESAGAALGEALAEAVAVLDPHGIVIGGGLGSAETPLREAALRSYARRVGRRPGAAPLLVAQCGHRSGLMGAAAAAWRSVDAG